MSFHAGWTNVFILLGRETLEIISALSQKLYSGLPNTSSMVQYFYPEGLALIFLSIFNGCN